MRTSPLLAATRACIAACAGVGRREVDEVSQVVRLTASLLSERLCARAPAECLPMHLNLRLKEDMSDRLLLTAYRLLG